MASETPNDQSNPSRMGSEPASSPELQELRKRINNLDAKLVELLNERAEAVVKVGEMKRGTGVPIYAPHREQEVLARVLKASQGPLTERTLEAVYREIMSGSFQLEQPLRIGYLGPPGSFSHEAATKHFGSSVSYEDVHEVAGVFTEVMRGHCTYGLAPIENSSIGGVAESLDAFIEHHDSVRIYAELVLNVHHTLLANCEPKEVKRIHSKPEALGQCRGWLSTQYPNAELVPAPSTSRAVQTAKAENMLEPGRGAAAIGSTVAGGIYGMKVLFEKIEDNPNNLTRFFIISSQEARPSGDDKTSIMFTTPDEPGALVRVLQVFERAGVNLTHIDKRPSGRVNWTYTFFIDAEGHRDDERLQQAIAEATGHCKDLHVLGSYPRARRIL
ncbi:MAG: prephenate dehydratase [Planctomycetota bacterium]